MLRWADELYQIYERFCGQPIGGDTAVLLPVAHSTANAQIEVTLSEDGTFQAANRGQKRCCDDYSSNGKFWFS